MAKRYCFTHHITSCILTTCSLIEITFMMMFSQYSVATVFMLVTAITATLDPATSNTNGSYPSAPSCSRMLHIRSSHANIEVNDEYSHQDQQSYPSRRVQPQHTHIQADLRRLHSRPPVRWQPWLALWNMRSIQLRARIGDEGQSRYLDILLGCSRCKG